MPPKKTPPPPVYLLVFLYVGLAVVFVLTHGAEYLLGEKQYADDGPALAITVVAALVAVAVYAYMNRDDLERLVRKRDYSVIRRLVLGKRKPRPAPKAD